MSIGIIIMILAFVTTNATRPNPSTTPTARGTLPSPHEKLESHTNQNTWLTMATHKYINDGHWSENKFYIHTQFEHVLQ
jgi:hypothetical protein